MVSTPISWVRSTSAAWSITCSAYADASAPRPSAMHRFTQRGSRSMAKPWRPKVVAERRKYSPTMCGPVGTSPSQSVPRGKPCASRVALLQASIRSSQSRSSTTRLGTPVVPPLSKTPTTSGCSP